MSSSIIDLVGVSKRFETNEVVSNVTLSIQEREFLSIIGPSGSGKSTILKMIVGVINPSGGQILFRSQDIRTSSNSDHGIVMVWQSLALFPHMNVQKNVGFGLLMRGIAAKEQHRRVEHFLDLVGLNGFGGRRIHELSGGEQQRVALARALIVEPKVVLLDEPLGGLDKSIRTRLMQQLREIHRTTGVTFIMVTHDQVEALSCSSRIAVLNKGRIEQVDEPTTVSLKPKSVFVAKFIGNKNVFTGSVLDMIQKEARVSTAAGPLTATIPDWLNAPIKPGMPVAYIIEPHRVIVGGTRNNKIKGRLDARLVNGGMETLHILVPDLGSVRCERGLTAARFAKVAEDVELSWRTRDAYVLPNP